MKTIDDLSEDMRSNFCEMVDEIVLNSGDDPELKEGFVYLDEIAMENNITFYDIVFLMYEESELEGRVRDWLDKKGYRRKN